MMPLSTSRYSIEGSILFLCDKEFQNGKLPPMMSRKTHSCEMSLERSGAGILLVQRYQTNKHVDKGLEREHVGQSCWSKACSKEIIRERNSMLSE